MLKCGESSRLSMGVNAVLGKAHYGIGNSESTVLVNYWKYNCIKQSKVSLIYTIIGKKFIEEYFVSKVIILEYFFLSREKAILV